MRRSPKHAAVCRGVKDPLLGNGFACRACAWFEAVDRLIGASDELAEQAREVSEQFGGYFSLPIQRVREQLRALEKFVRVEEEKTMTWPFPPGIGADLGLITKGTAESWATFSPDELYRYALARIWDDHGTLLVVVGLNPSTADHEHTDPTLRKLLHIAKRDGYGGLLLVNIAALRATDPSALILNPGRDVVGKHNQEVLRRAIDAPLLARAVAAWGAPKWKAIRPMISRALTSGQRRPWHCFGTTKAGHPRHPLYLKNDTAIRLWTATETSKAMA